MSTPISAPDFAVVSESIPAIPAQNATKNAKKSGAAIVADSEWSASVKVSGVTPRALKVNEARMTAAIPSGKPITSARPDASASARRRWTTATQTPATGPNSGPTTIAPTTRIAESR